MGGWGQHDRGSNDAYLLAFLHSTTILDCSGGGHWGDEPWAANTRQFQLQCQETTLYGHFKFFWNGWCMGFLVLQVQTVITTLASCWQARVKLVSSSCQAVENALETALSAHYPPSIRQRSASNLCSLQDQQPSLICVLLNQIRGLQTPNTYSTESTHQLHNPR